MMGMKNFLTLKNFNARYFRFGTVFALAQVNEKPLFNYYSLTGAHVRFLIKIF